MGLGGSTWRRQAVCGGESGHHGEMREADRVSPDAAISARNSSDRIQLPDCDLRQVKSDLGAGGAISMNVKRAVLRAALFIYFRATLALDYVNDLMSPWAKNDVLTAYKDEIISAPLRVDFNNSRR